MADKMQLQVAAEVRAEIARQNLSQVEVARLVGCHPSLISRKLASRRPFTTHDIESIGDALHVPWQQIVCRAAS